MMKKSLLGLAVGVSASISMLASPDEVNAVTASFDFSKNPAINYNTNSFTSVTGGFNLIQSNAVFVDSPTAGPLNSAPAGLCAWYNNNPSDTTDYRCGSTPALGGTVNSALSGFSFEFDKFVALKSFDVTGAANLSSGSISFSGGLHGTKVFNISGNGLQTFDSPFHVLPGTTVTIATSGTFANPSVSALFRINNLVVEEVPGPLPAFGVIGAMAWSRKLKSKLSK
jgi:hypothetical protein